VNKRDIALHIEGIKMEIQDCQDDSEELEILQDYLSLKEDLYLQACREHIPNLIKKIVGWGLLYIVFAIALWGYMCTL
jgi:hypothetical protein